MHLNIWPFTSVFWFGPCQTFWLRVTDTAAHSTVIPHVCVDNGSLRIIINGNRKDFYFRNFLNMLLFSQKRHFLRLETEFS